MAFLSPHNRLGADSAGYYSVDPLRRTLEELIDFDQLNNGGTRITVGASSVRTAEMRYFDSRDMPLSPRPCARVRCASAGISGCPHRRRALLGRRHSLEHAGRNRVRRQSAQGQSRLRGPHLEPARPRAGDDVGSDEPPEGRAIFDRAPPRTSSASASFTRCVTSSPNSARLVPEDKRRRQSVGEIGLLRLPHPDARRPPARARARLRGSQQGHRLQRRTASAGAAKPVIATRSRRSRRRPWRDPSTTSKASSCTKRAAAG